MKTKQIKAAAREQLLGKYGAVISAILLMQMAELVLLSVISSAVAVDALIGRIIYIVATILVSIFMGVFVAGRTYIFLKIYSNEQLMPGDIFHGFSEQTNKALVIQAILVASQEIMLIPYRFSTMLTGSAKFIVYAVIAVLCVGCIWVNVTFFVSFYMMYDFPELTIKELLVKSMQVTKGKKLRIVYVLLSFIPLYVLGILSFGIAFFWIIPYREATKTNLYIELVKEC